MMALLLACSSPPAPVAEPPSSAAPNVVLVIGCTVRADQTTPYGGPANTTPTLDALARRGVRMARTIAQAPWTKPSTAAIITGLFPADAGVEDPGPRSNDRRLPDEITTLAERFHDHGYRSVGVVGNPNVDAPFGFGQGFDVYVDTETNGTWQRKDLEGPALVDKALHELGARATQPFFLELLLLDAHQPNEPSAAELAPFADGDEPDQVKTYRAELRRMDDAIATLLDGLATMGVADRTLIVFVGDHGEGLRLPDHQGNGHGYYLYPSVSHVPWIAAGPGIASGGVVEGITRQLDVVPTLMGYLGWKADPTVEGSDLSPQWRSGGGASGIDRAWIYTTFQNAERAAFYDGDRLCQQDFAPTASAELVEKFANRGKRKKSPFPDGCFDLATDPEATRPVVDAVAAHELEAWRDARRKALSRWDGPAATLDDATRKRLEALGYTQ